MSCSTPELLDITQSLLGTMIPDFTRASVGETKLPPKWIMFFDGPLGSSFTKVDLVIQIGLPTSKENRK